MDLLNSSVVKRSGGKTNHNELGFACRSAAQRPCGAAAARHAVCSSFFQGHDIVGTSLQVSPEKFAPEGLCTCMPGWCLGLSAYFLPEQSSQL